MVQVYKVLKLCENTEKSGYKDTMVFSFTGEVLNNKYKCCLIKKLHKNCTNTL